MSTVIDHLANLTGFRDRDVVDSTLVTALHDLLCPREVAIYRRVGDAADLRWFTRARQGRLDSVPTSDPLWAPFESLASVQAHPARQHCLLGQQPLYFSGSPSLTVYPLLTDREATGVLEVVSDEPLDLAARQQVASILRLYGNFQSLLDYSERDTLTGLLNRKTFDEAFYKHAARTLAGLDDEPSVDDRRTPSTTPQHHYIGVIDIDHFKSVNDRFGHLIGDEVLLLLSRLMRACFRFNDQLYRFGGEEFVVMMRCGTDADAGIAFERLRQRVRQHAFPQVGQITISVGYTQVQVGDAPNSAFERADRAVYWAKGHGRDQVCSHAQLVGSGHLEDEAKVGDVELF